MADVTLTATDKSDFFDVLDLGYTSLTSILVDLGRGNDEIRSAAGDDTIFGGRGNDTIYGGFGNDIIDAGRHSDYVDGGKGDDEIHGGGGNDTLKAGAGDDIVYGGGGADIIYGVKGNNFLDGGAGADTIDTGVHSSVVQGGGGTDTLLVNLSKGAHHSISGGGSIDHFEFYGMAASRTAITSVTDFNLGFETFEIDGQDDVAFMVDLLNGVNGAVITDADAGAEIYLASDDYITFEGVTAAEMIDHYDDFVFV